MSGTVTEKLGLVSLLYKRKNDVDVDEEIPNIDEAPQLFKDDYTSMFEIPDDSIADCIGEYRAILRANHMERIKQKRREEQLEKRRKKNLGNHKFKQFFCDYDLPAKDFWTKTLKKLNLNPITFPKESEEFENAPKEIVEEIKLTNDLFIPIVSRKWEHELVFDEKDNVKLHVDKWAYAGWIPSANSSNMNTFVSKFPKMNQGFCKNTQNNVIYTDSVGLDKFNADKCTEWTDIVRCNDEDVNNDILDDEKWLDSPRTVDQYAKYNITNYLVDEKGKLLVPIKKLKSAYLSNIAAENEIKKVEEKKQERRSRILMGKVGLIKKKEEKEEEGDKKEKKLVEFFNLSNDKYYTSTKNYLCNAGSPVDTSIQHSIPTFQLSHAIFVTHMNSAKLRSFQRPKLKKFLTGVMSCDDFLPVYSVNTAIAIANKRRSDDLARNGGGDVCFLRHAVDLTAMDGEIVLMEYSEQYPPFLNEIGMCSKVKNYFKKERSKTKTREDDLKKCNYPFGEFSYVNKACFLGDLNEGESIQTLENNMYRAPVFQHCSPTTDFLIIRTKNCYMIRNKLALFVVSQELPKIPVPSPNSKLANMFLKDFLQVYIYRMFLKNEDVPKRIKMDIIRKAFPFHSESILRKRLKVCADFKRTGTGVDSNWWIIRSDFRIPREEEILSMVSPEQVCCYYSMIAAEQRLKDSGYADKNWNSQCGDMDKKGYYDGDSLQTKIALVADPDYDDNYTQMQSEIKCAPWNTTSAFCSAIKNKCLLSLDGVADPSGSGRQYSLTRIPIKPQIAKETGPNGQPKVVTGTDADLRKLPLKKARDILRKNDIPEKEIMKLTRWEVIDVVRQISNNQVKLGLGASKFARGSKFTAAENIEKYKEDCQRIFDLQNKILSSDAPEPIDYDAEDEEDDKLALQLEHMIDGDPDEEKRNKVQECLNKKLIIERSYVDENGKQYTRTEVVRNPMVIEAYTKIRESKDDEILRKFISLDDTQKEHMKKCRRRLQDQLRRLTKRVKSDKKKAKLMEKNGITSEQKVVKKRQIVKATCSACGQVGHMKTNRSCPAKFGTNGSFIMPSKNMIKIDGIKMKIKLPKLAIIEKSAPPPKKQKKVEVVKIEYVKPAPVSNRRRVDPVVSMSTIFMKVFTKMREIDNCHPFLAPVNSKLVPDYGNIIKKPMDLTVIRKNIQLHHYKSREDFLIDVNLILSNSVKYNGKTSVITKAAENLLETCLIGLAEQEEVLMKLETEINPMLNEDRRYALLYFFETIVLPKMKLVKNSTVFHHQVSNKISKAYNEKIKKPMHLDLIYKKAKKLGYLSKDVFMNDVKLILSNSLMFNGPGYYSNVAQEMITVAETLINEHLNMLIECENEIKSKMMQ